TQTTGGVDQRKIAGRGDNHCTIDGYGLRQAELRVAGARWHIDDQVICAAPIYVLEELPHDAGDDGATPDNGRVVFHQKSERHQADVVHLKGYDLFIFNVGALVDAQEGGHARSVDVDIEETDAEPE